MRKPLGLASAILILAGVTFAVSGAGAQERATSATHTLKAAPKTEAHADHSGFAPGRLSGGGFGKRRAAGIGVAKSDDVVASRGDAGEKNRGFVGLGAGVGEEAFLELAGSDLRELFGERNDLFIGIER